jgi:ribosomal protein S18 acetylase RimI-like enzyme
MKKALIFVANRLWLILLLYLLSLLVGAAAFAAFEGQSLGDSLWWAAVTALTIGYGDLAPVSFPGRLVGVLLGHFWIFAVIPMIVANIVVNLVEDKNLFSDEEQEEMKARLKSIEDRLVAWSDRIQLGSMKAAEIPDKNIFMMCEVLNQSALAELPAGYSIRNCRPDELAIWKSMPFDDIDMAKEYESFMSDYFHTTYGGQEELFFAKTLFVCDRQDRPIGTCLIWKAYGEFNTVQWFRVLKEYEGQGIGRALLSTMMVELTAADYPVYLHTQPASFRAIGLYSDFGFSLLAGDKFGIRENDLVECLPILGEFMTKQYFQRLRITTAPQEFGDAVNKYDTNQF